MKHTTIFYRLGLFLLEGLIWLWLVSARPALASVPAPGTSTSPAPPAPTDITTLVKGAR